MCSVKYVTLTIVTNFFKNGNKQFYVLFYLKKLKMDINFEDFQSLCRICASSGKLQSLQDNNFKQLLQKITDMNVNISNINLLLNK